VRTIVPISLRSVWILPSSIQSGWKLYELNDIQWPRFEVLIRSFVVFLSCAVKCRNTERLMLPQFFRLINHKHLLPSHSIIHCLCDCYYYYCSFTAFCWALAAFSVSWSYKQSVGLLGRGISPSQGLYLHREQHKHRINALITDIHALIGIWIQDPSVWADEDSSCLRLRGHRDRL
jgi:hypothetical protein